MTLIGSRVSEDLPKIVRVRLRGYCNFEFKRPRRYVILGIADTGKSMLNETLALFHPKILDLYGSRDNENLCWCRDSSPIDNILLIHGENTDVSCSWDTIKANEVTMKVIEDYEVITTCASFYSSSQMKYRAIQIIADVLYTRLGFKKENIIYMLLRETMNVIYSRTSQGVGEKDAKADILYFIREMRHFGVSIGADTLRWTGIDKELRDIADYTIFKNVGEKGLPYEKRWLYSIIEPKTFRRLKAHEFVLLKANGDIAFSTFPALPFHKEEGVNLLQELGIEITHGEEIVESTSGKVGDKEHTKIIHTYLESESMNQVKNIVKRSLSTIHSHVDYHNKKVITVGRCDRCERVGSDSSDVHAKVR